VKEIDFEIDRFHTFQTFMTLILTLDQVLWHISVIDLSTCTPNFVQIGKTSYGRTDGHI